METMDRLMSGRLEKQGEEEQPEAEEQQEKKMQVEGEERREPDLKEQ